VLVNGTALAGHVRFGRRSILSGNSVIHQFTWIGELVMTQGLTATSMHVPPYCMIAEINCVVGLNKVGLRRAEDIGREDYRQIEEAFRLTYRSGLRPAEALEEMDRWDDMTAAAAKFREFIRRVLAAEGPWKRGLCTFGRGYRSRRG
ncbi:MAG: acyl-ACP--UDP-N-acetylglucosamine O-acyltransferase, partial [Planctomycetes bacterium]|nr:acyl-ACP--UDP-N-acetylglucosamine O-acyltransferase [Planctomycetota bacterium]